MKLTYNSDMHVAEDVELPSVEMCAFLLCNFFVRGMQVNFICNVEYVYVCKICEEKFGGCWWSFS